MHALLLAAMIYLAPDVTCHIYSGPALVQIDCVGSVLREPYERLVPVDGVYDALRPMFAEWRTDVRWDD